MNKCTCRSCIRAAFTAPGGWTLCQQCMDADCSPWPCHWYEADGEPFPMAVGYECQVNRPPPATRPEFSSAPPGRPPFSDDVAHMTFTVHDGKGSAAPPWTTR